MKTDKLNLSVKDIGGGVLAVSQFTLLGDVRKGKRPSFTKAAAPEEANALYRKVIELIQAEGHPCRRRDIPRRHDGRDTQ